MTSSWNERNDILFRQPEIQLLYEAKGLRDTGQLDFESTRPHLDQRRRDWLGAALEQTLPGHPWPEHL